MLVHMGLNEQGILLGIQAAGNVLGQLLQGAPPQVCVTGQTRNWLTMPESILFLGAVVTTSLMLVTFLFLVIMYYCSTDIRTMQGKNEC